MLVTGTLHLVPSYHMTLQNEPDTQTVLSMDLHYKDQTRYARQRHERANNRKTNGTQGVPNSKPPLETSHEDLPSPITPTAVPIVTSVHLIPATVLREEENDVLRQQIEQMQSRIKTAVCAVLVVMLVVIIAGVSSVVVVCGIQGKCGSSSGGFPSDETSSVPTTQPRDPPTQQPTFSWGTASPVTVTALELPSPTLATATESPTCRPSELPPPDPSSDSYYYNVGEIFQTYVDAAGREWLPASIPRYSTTHSICDTTPATSFQNTNDGQLYCSEIWIENPESLDFDFRVPNKDYQIVLHFAETFVDGPGKRVMDLYVQNRLVEANFDIFQTANGAYTATQWFGDASVTDYNLSISLKGTTQNAKLNAIEIHPAVTAVPEFPLRINSGARAPVQDGNGITWEVDQYFTTGYYDETNRCASNGTGPPWCKIRSFNTKRNPAPYGYGVPVENGDYTVTVHVIETYYTAPGERIMDVLVEGVTVYAGLDVAALTGWKLKPFSFSVNTTVTDGQLDVHVQSVYRDPLITGIEIDVPAVATISPAPSESPTTSPAPSQSPQPKANTSTDPL